MRIIRVFVSSPGDAENERKRVVRVMERLNAAFAGTAQFQPVLWEERYYSAHDGFQQQIGRSTDCDLVVAILRGRLGTPLPPDFMARLPEEDRLADLAAYQSGTAYEILSAIAARRRGAKLPDIFVFRYPHNPVVGLDDENRADIEAQWQKLKGFAEQVFVSEEGHFRGAYQTFSSTDDFETQAEGALRQWLSENVVRDSAVVWPIAIKGSPFRGLEPFGAKHAEVFYGRDGDRARALDRLKDAADAGFPFLAVIGPSGAGKSSFARAGILPWLVKPGAVMGVGVWRTAVMRPSDHPNGAVASLAHHLFDDEKDIAEPEAGRPIALPELASGDNATPQALAGLFSVFARGKFERAEDLESAGHAALAPIEKALKAVAETERKAWGSEKEAPARLLLVIDQFDDLFAPGADEEARTAFARLIERLARSGLVWIVATLRAEFYEAFLKSPLARLASPEVPNATRRLELTFDLLPPGLPEMAEIVRGPARAAGLNWETDPASMERLDDRLLTDIDRPDLLPLVQFVLEQLYEQRARKDETDTLTFDAYRALGTLNGAIDKAAEKALSQLGPAEQAALPRLLRALVTYARSTSGSGNSAVALIQAHRKIAAHDEASTRLVDALTEARILVSGNDQDKAPTIALAHQRVIEAWQRAQKVVAESEGLLRARDEVEEARRRWIDSGQQRDLLIPAGLPLSEAENAASTLGDELPAETRSYIQKSGRAARLRQTLTAVAAIAFLVVAGVAGWQWVEASAQRNLAEKQTVIAEGQRAETESQKQVAERNFAAAKTAVDGLIFNIVAGFKDVSGLRVETIRNILETTRKTVDQLQATAPENEQLLYNRSQMLVQFARIYISAGVPLDAQKAAKDSLDILRSLIKRYPSNFFLRSRLLASMALLGQVHLKAGNRAYAVIRSRECVDQARQLVKLDSDVVRAIDQLDVCLSGLGRAESSMSDKDGALAAFQESLSISRRLVELNPDNEGAKSNLAAGLVSYGNAKLDLGDQAGALDAYQEEVGIIRDLIKGKPDNIRSLLDLTVGLENAGNLKFSTGDQAGAFAAYQESLEIQRGLAQLDSSNVDMQHGVSKTLLAIGDLKLKAGDLSGATTAVQESLDIDRRLAAKNPANHLLQYYLRSSLKKLGEVKVGTDDPAGAAAAFQESLDLARTEYPVPDDITQYEIMIDLINLGGAKLRAGDTAGAFALVEENLAFVRKLVALSPDSARQLNNLSIALQTIADVKRRGGDEAGALAADQEDKEIKHKLSELATTDAEQSHLVLKNLKYIGDKLLGEGDETGALAAYEEYLDRARRNAKGKPDDDQKNALVDALGGSAYLEILVKDYAKSLLLCDEAIALAPDQVWLQANRAHALMLLGRTNEALAIYLEYRGKVTHDNKFWEQEVRDDFAALRKIGITNTTMDEVETDFEKPTVSVPSK